MKKSLKRRVKGLYQRPAMELARAYRPYLAHHHVIGITGSSGKTTAKDVTAAVLSTSLAGPKSYDTTNGAYSIARTLLATRPYHDFCVQEVGAFCPGSLDPLLRILRPTVGAITVIGNEHYGSFKGMEGVVREKRKLVDILPTDGIAVLNVDDPYLADVASNAHVRVVRFGRSQAAEVRATDVAACYPDRLSFTVSCRGEEARVQTRLLGEHQLVPVLTAIAIGHALGVPLDSAIHAIESCASTRSRMELVETKDGVTFINDSYKLPYWTLESVFDFMRNARAGRKWIVLGQISDHAIRPGQLYRRLAKSALASCDQAVFIGRSTHHAPESGGRIHSFAHVREADAFLRAELAAGDLVLIKGNNVGEHLVRLFLSRTQTVSCWREDCGLAIDCRSCRRLAR